MIRPIDMALRHEGVRESGGRNRGPEVDAWLRRVGKDPERALAWCAAFASCMVYDACEANWLAAGNAGPIDPETLATPMTAGVWAFWSGTPRGYRCGPKEGAAYVLDHGVDPRTGFRRGHIGFAVELQGPRFVDISGNTNAAGSREGDGVLRNRRRIEDVGGRWIDVDAVVSDWCAARGIPVPPIDVV